MDARLPRTLVQDRYSLPRQGEHLQANRPRLQLEPGDDRSTVEGIRCVLLQLRTIRKPDEFLGHGHQLGPCRLAEVLGEEEEVGEVHRAAAVEIEAEVGVAEGLGEEEEVRETRPPVAVEVGGGLGGGGEGHRL